MGPKKATAVPGITPTFRCNNKGPSLLFFKTKKAYPKTSRVTCLSCALFACWICFMPRPCTQKEAWNHNI